MEIHAALLQNALRNSHIIRYLSYCPIILINQLVKFDVVCTVHHIAMLI